MVARTNGKIFISLPSVGASSLLRRTTPLFVYFALDQFARIFVRIPHAVGATPSSAHDQICLLRGFAAKIHFMVGASSFPQNALRWRFVGALFSGISDVYLFTFSLTFSFLPSANLLAFSVRIPYAVGATPCGRPNQWKNFHFAAVRRCLLFPASNHAPFRSFCPWPKFTFRSGSPLSHQSYALMGALFYLFGSPAVLCAAVFD